MRQDWIWRWSVLGVAAIAVAGLWRGLDGQAEARNAAMIQLDAPTRVAVIDLARVMQDLDEFTDRKVELDVYDKTLEARVNSLREEANEAKEAVEVLAEGSSERKAQVERRDFKAAQMLATGEVAKIKALKSRQRLIFEVHQNILKAADEYARTNNIDIVLNNDHKTGLLREIDVKSLGTSLAHGRIVYAGAAVDITDYVITMMNAQYMR